MNQRLSRAWCAVWDGRARGSEVRNPSPSGRVTHRPGVRWIRGADVGCLDSVDWEDGRGSGDARREFAEVLLRGEDGSLGRRGGWRRRDFRRSCPAMRVTHRLGVRWICGVDVRYLESVDCEGGWGSGDARREFAEALLHGRTAP